MPGLLDSDRWGLPEVDAACVRELGERCGVVPLVARTLVARGIRTPEAARRFLTPSLERDWEDPLGIPGMSEAADRLASALAAGEAIAVFGDFDVDGMSATCLLTKGLRDLGADVRPFIPDRFAEGYGLTRAALGRLLDDGRPDLIVTVDNGIAAQAEVAWIRSQGIDVVVTDHHEPAGLVPVGVAVCDPKMSADCPSRELAGAGVALKLLQVVGARRGAPDLWRAYVDLATLGTVSDMMLLAGENRALVREGVALMRQGRRPGIVALAASARTELSSVTADVLPFSLIPRLNAAGRMGKTVVAFELLMADDMPGAVELAERLEQINAERRDIEAGLAEEAFEAIDASYHGERVIVVAGEGWHEGVKGIVASRVTNRYHVPSILLSVRDGVARGSGRSVGTVDLFKAVSSCSDLLVRFGGHAGAVGVTCEVGRLDAFRAALEAYMDALPAEEFASRGELASLVSLSEMTVDNLAALEVLQPFGQGNKKPLFGCAGVMMRNRARVGAAGNHLRFAATDGVASVPSIMFRAPQIERAVGCEGAVDLVFEPVNETWQGRTKPKLMVKDILYRDDEPPRPAELVALTDGLFADASSDDPAASAGGEDLGSPDGDETVEATLQALSTLSYDELTDALRRRLLGSAPLLPAQRETLDRLAAGRSCLCVMATGRGKSLIFHLHAAREALAHGRASVFVYPLRALISDQSYHLAHAMRDLGVGVRVLTGETPQAKRDETYEALARGVVSVVLTTPEFLSLHVARLARSRRIGFVVVDEAHHADTLSSAGRGAYGELPRVLGELGGPTTLAVTATADPSTARAVLDLLGLAETDVVVDATERPNLHVMDLRAAPDRDAALVNIVASGEKTVIYVNGRQASRKLARMLRDALPDLGHAIAFYHAGLGRPTRLRVEGAFRTGLITTIVSTSAFGEGVNLSDVRNVVLYHLPFDKVEFNQMSGRAGRDGDDAAIWLLFGARDAELNERILAAQAPDRDAMAQLFATIRRLCDPGDTTTASDEDIASAASATYAPARYDARQAASAVATFAELGLIALGGDADARVISLLPIAGRVALERSSGYRAARRQAREFESFSKWVLSSSRDTLSGLVGGPLLPGFGQVADGGDGQ
ncbi:single-stranded-DNA-specific exonuclease RecJ [Olsenella sp. HMSC062G07]|uniref:single-stranded-DNA-specific exonuclease RecJ n=1 Tax=Olsenella sp. HMSC062G07 TaxID=1739330 RepID=UPI0008A2301F|nr:single-stranded-DNA-specific exonuclease RecJ [Olsenella sp. HMSC062G07]OFK24009.1 single-stranded-DNA-specific exonuclease RecJ [Olsenella sp. HMSC062G07]